MSDGGKGSAPRKTQDQEAYSKGWDAIFGNDKRNNSDEVFTIVDKTPPNVQNEQHNEKQRCGQTD